MKKLRVKPKYKYNFPAVVVIINIFAGLSILGGVFMLVMGRDSGYSIPMFIASIVFSVILFGFAAVIEWLYRIANREYVVEQIEEDIEE